MAIERRENELIKEYVSSIMNRTWWQTECERWRQERTSRWQLHSCCLGTWRTIVALTSLKSHLCGIRGTRIELCILSFSYLKKYQGGETYKWVRLWVDCLRQRLEISKVLHSQWTVARAILVQRKWIMWEN